jgi:hypothetical protein
MATNTFQEPQFQLTSQGEVVPASLQTEEIDAVAFKLWRHASCLNMMADECECCKGAAQECFVTCR